MNPSKPLATGLAALLLAGCGTAYSGGEELLEVQARRPSRMSSTCSSYLYSSRTGQKYCASPAFDAIDPNAATAGPTYGPGDEPVTGPLDQAALMERGAKVYNAVCIACHQADGKGTPGAFPPLAGAGSFYGDPKNMAKIVVHGLTGEITVLGNKFNGIMPAQGAALSDVQIAAVTTYVRNSFGNNDGIVTVEDVAAVR